MDYNQAAETLKRLSLDREAMAFAAEAFERLGSISGATKEAEKARAVAEKARDAMREQMGAAQARLDKATSDANQVLADADITAAKLMDDTASRCRQAEAESKQRIASDQNEEKKRTTQAMADHDHKMQVIMESIRDLEKQEKTLATALAAKAVELGNLEARMAKIREAAAALA